MARHRCVHTSRSGSAALTSDPAPWEPWLSCLPSRELTGTHLESAVATGKKSLSERQVQGLPAETTLREPGRPALQGCWAGSGQTRGSRGKSAVHFQLSEISPPHPLLPALKARTLAESTWAPQGPHQGRSLKDSVSGRVPCSCCSGWRA